MKKTIMIMCAILTSIVTFAQSADYRTVEYSRPLENVYVNLDLGAQGQTFNFDKNYQVLPVAGLELGKDVTPVVGLSVEGFAAFNTDKNLGIVNNTNVTANAKFNLMNLFGGYKEEPRRFEILVVPGIGWGHDFMTPNAADFATPEEYDAAVAAYDPNYATYNTFAQINFNLGKQKAWAVNIKPGVVWAAKNGTNFKPDYAAPQVTFGITYKFNNRRTKSHNFVRSPYSVTKVDYDTALAEIERLKNRKPEVREIIKETIVEKIVTNRVVETIPGITYITFGAGKAELTEVEAAKVKNFINQLPEDAKIEITGSADSATGTPELNAELAANRAKAVADAIVKAGIDTAKIATKTALDVNENAEASRSAVVKAVL